jgi:hypothetical protein
LGNDVSGLIKPATQPLKSVFQFSLMNFDLLRQDRIDDLMESPQVVERHRLQCAVFHLNLSTPVSGFSAPGSANNSNFVKKKAAIEVAASQSKFFNRELREA